MHYKNNMQLTEKSILFKVFLLTTLLYLINEVYLIFYNFSIKFYRIILLQNTNKCGKRFKIRFPHKALYNYSIVSTIFIVSVPYTSPPRMLSNFPPKYIYPWFAPMLKHAPPASTPPTSPPLFANVI